MCSASFNFPWIVIIIIRFPFCSALPTLLLRKLDREDVSLPHVVVPDPGYLCCALGPLILVTPSSESVTAVEAGSCCLIEDMVRNLAKNKSVKSDSI